VFEGVLALIGTSLDRIPHSEQLKTKALFYLHRMISCLGGEILRNLSSFIIKFLNTNNPKELSEFIKLITQLISKFKDMMANGINELLLPLINKINFDFINSWKKMLSLQSTSKNLMTEIEREILEMKKIYYSLLNTILGNNLATVFVSEKNISSFGQILNTIIDGMMDNDTNIARNCVAIAKRMIEFMFSLKNQNQFQSVLAEFDKWLFEISLPIIIKAPLRLEFDVRDASSVLVIAELATIQITIVQKYGEQSIQFFKNILQSLQVPQNIILVYLEMLMSKNQKEFKEFQRNLKK